MAKKIGFTANNKENSLDKAVDYLLNASDYITDKSSFYSKVNSNINNELTRTVGNVSNVVGNMIPSIASNVVAPGSGLIVTGMSAGGNSAQETINNDRTNLNQAVLTGIAKGGVEALTEKLTGGNILSKGSLDDFVGKTISSKVKSDIGKKIANKAYQFAGEMLEEQISDNAGYLIDKVLNNKKLPDFEEWWNNAGETNKITFLSTLALNLVGLGGSNVENVDAKTQQMVNEVTEHANNDPEMRGILQNTLNSINNEQLVNNQIDNNVLPTARSTNQNVANNQEVLYNSNESESGINGERQNGQGTSRILEELDTRLQQEEKSQQNKKYSRSEYDQWEQTIIPITDSELTQEQKQLKDNIKGQYGKDIVFFDGNENDYNGGASLRNSNNIYINRNDVNEFGINKVALHEILESNIAHNPELKNDIINPTIKAIVNDNNFQEQKNKFWEGQEGDIPSDYMIAKDILCDRFSELKSGEKLDYDNVLSQETNMTIDFAIENFEKQLERKTVSEGTNINIQREAIAEELKSKGAKVDNEGNVTLYHITTPDNYQKITTDGYFIPNNSPIGGMVGEEIGPRSFFSFDKDWVETWRQSKDSKILEIKVPAEYIRQGAKNEKEVYIEGALKKRNNNIWTTDQLPTSTFYDRKAVKTYLNKSKTLNLSKVSENIQEVKQAPTTNDNTLETAENQKRKTLNPTEISNLKPEDVSTIPKLQNKKYENGNKQSSFYSNVTEKSKFLNEDFRNVMKQDENIEYYKTVSNKETLEKAYNKLQENGQSEVMRWHSKDSKKATSEDVAEGWILLKQYQDAGNYDSAVEVAKKMRDIGTTAGQTVQAYNILSRLTPEGMFYYAQSELSEAYNKMVEGKSKKWIDANKGNFDLTPEETKFIMDTMQEVSTIQDGYDKKVKLAEIQKVITDKIPATAGQSIKAWMRISMLFNPKTQVRNVMGNAVIMPVNMFSDSVSAGIDKLISKKTGVRTTGNLNIKSYAKGFGKGLYESYNDFKKGINTRNIEGNRFEISEGRNFNNKGLGKALNRVDNLLSFMLDAGDRGFYEATFTNSINNQLVLNNTTEVTQEMIDIATSEALQRTWQDNNNYTKAVLGIRKILNNVNIKGYGLGDVLIPFAKTPANLTKAIVDCSPVGLVKTLGSDAIKLKNSLENGQYTPQLQHQFVQNLGKATAGTFLYVLGYALAQAGIITGEADDDKDVKNFMKNSLGMNSYSIKIGNKSFSYDWAQPIATPFAIMANYVKYSKDNPEASAIDKAINAMNIGTEQLLQQSFMESLNTFLNGSGTTLENLSQAVLELPSRAIPTFSKQIADMVDSTQRTSFEYDKPIQSAFNSVIAKIPFASKTLPASVDTLGNEIKKYGGDNNLFNVFFNPANMNKGELSKAGEEIYNIYQETGDSTIFPRTAPYYINNNGEKVTMTAKERSDFQRISGTYVEDTLTGLLNNKDYKKLNNEEKVKIINEIVNDSYSKAKYDVLKLDSEEYKKLRDTLNKVKTTTYYDYKFKTEEVKTNNEKIDVLVNSKYSDKEKEVLYETYILSNKDTKYDIIKGTFTSKGLNISKYLEYETQEFTSDKADDGTVNGKSISGSKKEKVLNYINSIEGATYTQKLILAGLEYSLSDYEKSQIVNYIDSLDKTEKEKLDILSNFKGFTIYKDGTFDY